MLCVSPLCKYLWGVGSLGASVFRNCPWRRMCVMFDEDSIDDEKRRLVLVQ